LIHNILDMESMNDKIFIRNCIRYEFHQQKFAAQAYTSICSVLGDEVLSKSKCEFGFHRFRAGNFDVNDFECSEATYKVKFVDFQALLDIDSSQTKQKLTKIHGKYQQTISKRLRAKEKKNESGDRIN